MCRLLGIKNFDYSKHFGLLEDFANLAVTGQTPPGSKPGHNDGWGIGWYSRGKAFVRKSGKPLTEEKKAYAEILAEIWTSEILIVHLRKSAWQGTSSERHSHPFEYRNIILAHNGTILDYEKLLEAIRPENRPLQGSLDTEVFLRHIAEGAQEGIENAFQKSVLSVTNINRYTSLNCVFSDGVCLYAYREYSENPEYYSLYAARDGDSCVICSETISKGLNWEPVARKELLIA